MRHSIGPRFKYRPYDTDGTGDMVQNQILIQLHHALFTPDRVRKPGHTANSLGHTLNLDLIQSQASHQRSRNIFLTGIFQIFLVRGQDTRFIGFQSLGHSFQGLIFILGRKARQFKGSGFGFRGDFSYGHFYPLLNKITAPYRGGKACYAPLHGVEKPASQEG